MDARSQSSIVAHNLRRIMARGGMTYDDVCEATGLDTRTLRGIITAAKRTHSRTLQRLAEGLGVTIDELFAADGAAAIGQFDAATNPAVEDAVAERPDLFEGWSPSEFGELASRFGEGGALTTDGVYQAAEQMNANRAALRQARVVLESDQAEVFRGMVQALYERVVRED